MEIKIIIYLSLALLLTIIAFYFTIKFLRKHHSKKIELFNQKIDQLNSEIKVLTDRVDFLSKYEVIIDVEKRLKAIEEEIIAKKYNAKICIQKWQEKAGIEIEKKKIEIDVIKKETDNLNKQARLDYIETLSVATKEAGSLIQLATIRAESISCDAYKALKESKDLTQTIEALKNTIKGYGNKYMIPHKTIMDELADEYSHHLAGQKLKGIRDSIKQLIANDEAANCDYNDDYRRINAIRFVIDAFNDKVDTILLKAKHDNYGKLHQKINDAFYLVNSNGKAFRNARVKQLYLDYRLEELKWVVAVHELKRKEHEEQREIRRQIREEEKAKRDYEKVLKEAEIQEEILQKSMELARQELAKASAAECEKYEQKLNNLKQQLKEAEEKNQRAKSMAEQTKRGHVYIISNIGSFGKNIYKIGLTRRLEPLDRVKELGDASVPFGFDVHAMIYNEDAPSLEIKLHKKFQDAQVNKVNPRKEFFKTSLKEIKNTLDKMNIKAKWTMMAEAAEYRETLAIEQKQNPEKFNIKKYYNAGKKYIYGDRIDINFTTIDINKIRQLITKTEKIKNKLSPEKLKAMNSMIRKFAIKAGREIIKNL